MTSLDSLLQTHAFSSIKKISKTSYPHHDPATIVMLRKGVRTSPADLRRLFDNLKSLRNQRTSTLTELPTPKTHANKGSEITVPEGTTRKWRSVEEMEAADAVSDNEPNIRVFQQTIEPPQLLKKSIESLSETPILDAVTGLDRSAPSAGVLTKVELHHLRKLTNGLNFLSHSPVSIAKEIFYWLEKFRSNPAVLKLLTPHAWTLLWALETDKIPSFRSRLIGDMMESAGVRMDEHQTVAHIGGLFWNGAKDEAFQRWRGGIHKWKRSQKYWNLGIRMFSLNQEPYEARYWLGQMINALGEAEPKAFIPIIMSFNHIYHIKQGWRTYHDMQICSERTGEKITVSQYDDLCMSFLDGGAPQYGLEIYKKMVFSKVKALERMQTDIYDNLSNLVLAAQDKAQVPRKLNKISGDALMCLPPKVQDKYFYGSWLKNAMRMGRTDLAWYLVRDVMAKQEFPPDSIHYNWIIQGFLEEKNLEMAEKIAEEMVKSRLQKLETTAETDGWKDWSNKEASIVGTDQPITSLTDITLTPGPTPPATIQTFSLLMNYHTRRHHMEKVVALSSTMSSCKLRPNSFIFNHLLYSLLRIHDIPRFMRTYLTILKSSDAKPDMETWNIMWLAMWKRHTQKHRRFEELLPPRALFADMVKNLRRAQLKDKAEIEKMKNIWRTVIKSFMLSRDFPGALIALHAGIKVWNMKVDDTVVREVVFGVMKARSWNPEREDRPKILPEMVDGSVERLKLQARYLLRRRRGIGDRRTGLWKSVKDPEGFLEGLTLMLGDTLGDKARVKAVFDTAKNEMGVDGLEID